AVLSLQLELRQLGYDLQGTGTYADKTLDAVRDFQRYWCGVSSFSQNERARSRNAVRSSSSTHVIAGASPMRNNPFGTYMRTGLHVKYGPWPT
ncbi:peptidoglycan-binding domain-containing protein, partial [Kibdelosporangium lantanae]